MRRLGIGLLATSAMLSVQSEAKDASPTPALPLDKTVSTPQQQPGALPSSDDRSAEFLNPPASARPRVWWHWMNGNISKPGIAADLAWMKRVGIGGLQNFDIDLSTSQIVDKRLVYMTPEWKDAFRFAAQEADRNNLELAIASSPGWSETGGPWVAPEDAMKKLVWSETLVRGGRKLSVQLPAPPAMSGPYQALPKQLEISDLIAKQEPKQGPTYYRDSYVVAVPVQPAPPLPAPKLTDGTGRALTSTIEAGDGFGGFELGNLFAPQPPSIRLDYGKPVTVCALTLHIPGGAIPLLGPLLVPLLQSSENGADWHDITPVALEDTPSTIAFAPVTARYFRIVVSPPPPGAPNPAAEEARRNLAMDDVFGKAIGGLLGRGVKIGQLALHAESRIDRAQAKAGFAIADDYLALPSLADGATGPAAAQTIDLTANMRADGTLDWTPPAGNWKIFRFGYSLLGKSNHPAPAEATGLEVDKYDGDAVRRYLDHYLANYRDAAGPDLLGPRGVGALLTDSIEVGAANWTPQIVEQFKRLRGYDPLPWFPALTGMIVGSRDDSERFLFDYRRTLADLMSSEHYGTIAAVAHQNGLKVYGESIEGHRSTFGDDMAMRRHADYPMAAMWTFDKRSGPSPSYIVDIKGAASVSHIYGQNIVAAESMTVGMAPWAFGPADLKHIVDLEFVLGVNRPVVHTSVHVPVEGRKPGLSLAGIGQFFNRNESWAELAKPWVDYLSRNSWMLQQGRDVADIAFYYGEEAPLSGLYGKTRLPPVPQGYAFDFLNNDALLSALDNDGPDLQTKGGARYRVLYLGGSSNRMSLATLRRVAELVEGGATIIGMAPEGPPGLEPGTVDQYATLVRKLWTGAAVTRVGRGQVIATANLAEGVATIGLSPDLNFEGASATADLPFVHRKLADGDSYFIVNRTDKPEQLVAHFRMAGKMPERWYAEDGRTEPLSYRTAGDETIVPLSLAPGDAAHIVFRKDATALSQTVRPANMLGTAAIANPWRVSFEAGRGVARPLIMAQLAPLDQNADAAVRHFSGIATYDSTFRTPRNWTRGSKLKLDLGEAREIAEVTINGKPAGHVWHAPYQLDITGLARRGSRNTIRVRVANLWVNRLIGDVGKPDADKVSWTSVPTYKASAPLRRSGLVGPVRLLIEDR